jgi:hypothetical protein
MGKLTQLDFGLVADRRLAHEQFILRIRMIRGGTGCLEPRRVRRQAGRIAGLLCADHAR